MVTWQNKRFEIDGEELKIFSGSIHYFRSVPEKWYDLLLKLKNAGMNTVETYSCWNLHEPKPSVYDFDGRLDIERFIKTAQELGLYVILRPGPYICAEWENGGLPAWLLKNENIRLRTVDEEYLSAVRRWFDVLIPKILPYLQTNGGNIILVGAENEYGSFGNSTEYMNTCADMLRNYGVDVPIFTSDGHLQMFLSGGHADDTLCALDFGYEYELNETHFSALDQFQPEAPHLHVEHWIGAMSHWGEPVQDYNAETVGKEVRQHLEQNASFNLYMFHGGTNFGFLNGANSFNNDPENRTKLTYFADVTSYDYGAPLTEWGECTPKYFAIQKEMERYLGKELPKPQPVETQNLGEVCLNESADLFANLENIGQKFCSPCLYGMEHFGQNFGYILYRTQIVSGQPINLLAFGSIADRVRIYFNGIYRGTLDRNDERKYFEVDGWMNEGGTLDLLVENMGRVNFGPELLRGDRKGLLDYVFVSSEGGPRQLLHNWEVFTLPMHDLSGIQATASEDKHPTFYKGYFSAESQKDCFIHPDGFTKGFITVNGFNLGRYWKIGPQRSLYLPGALLKAENEIIVFES
ncbi:MAG: beta-galactosidase, partial [Clostridia bacterium]|nr:beta-galactosidase [Clostridia bacterium]